nr:FkbM family methyltransferase [uncultured Butyrivibrio sp.]
MIDSLREIYEKIQDEESKHIFDMLLSYAITRNDVIFLDELRKMNKEWTISSRDEFSNMYGGQKIVIYGAGAYGRMTKLILEQAGYSIYAFCGRDNNRVLDGIPVIKLEELIADDEDYYYVLASRVYWKDMYEQLGTYYKFNHSNIFIPRTGAIIATCGEQYLDCTQCSLEDGDFIVDCGMCEGETIVEMAKKCNYSKIIGIEANEYAYNKAKMNLRDYQNVELYMCAAWNQNGRQRFSADGLSSKIENGDDYIETKKIDSILDGRRASFIKMDIEGAERNALEGARETIMKYHPKLAICIYHQVDDFVEIPRIILAIDNSYRFCFRHYNSNMWESVVYAF